MAKCAFLRFIFLSIEVHLAATGPAIAVDVKIVEIALHFYNLNQTIPKGAESFLNPFLKYHRKSTKLKDRWFCFYLLLK